MSQQPAGSDHIAERIQGSNDTDIAGHSDFYEQSVLGKYLQEAAYSSVRRQIERSERRWLYSKCQDHGLARLVVHSRRQALIPDQRWLSFVLSLANLSLAEPACKAANHEARQAYI